MKYTVEPCVCDYCIKNDKNEIVLILNSRANALTICEILNADENHENEMLVPICWESEKRKQIIKEAKKVILQQMKDIVVRYRGVGCGVHPLMFELKNLAKQHGVEVEE